MNTVKKGDNLKELIAALAPILIFLSIVSNYTEKASKHFFTDLPVSHSFSTTGTLENLSETFILTIFALLFFTLITFWDNKVIEQRKARVLEEKKKNEHQKNSDSKDTQNTPPLNLTEEETKKIERFTPFKVSTVLFALAVAITCLYFLISENFAPFHFVAITYPWIALTVASIVIAPALGREKTLNTSIGALMPVVTATVAVVVCAIAFSYFQFHDFKNKIEDLPIITIDGKKYFLADRDNSYYYVVDCDKKGLVAFPTLKDAPTIVLKQNYLGSASCTI